jgi:hypothetical protein
VIEVVGVDGDDTLWHSETLFSVTQERMRSLLSPYVAPGVLDERLLVTERRNLRYFGHGVKGFVLSMIETAVEVSDGRVSAAEVSAIVPYPMTGALEDADRGPAAGRYEVLADLRGLPDALVRLDRRGPSPFFGTRATASVGEPPKNGWGPSGQGWVKQRADSVHADQRPHTPR